jgi:hypothetical protein
MILQHCNYYDAYLVSSSCLAVRAQMRLQVVLMQRNVTFDVMSTSGTCKYQNVWLVSVAFFFILIM